MLIVIVAIVSALYFSIGLWRFIQEMNINAIGSAFGWPAPPPWTVAVRSVFWPVVVVLEAFLNRFYA